MVFSTTVFLLQFLPLVIGLHLILPRALRNPFLLAASLLFYAWGEQLVVLVMLLSIGVNYGLGLLFGMRERPAFVARFLGFAAVLQLGAAWFLHGEGVPPAFLVGLGLALAGFDAWAHRALVRAGGEQRSRWVIATSVVFNLGLLVYFKYTGFLLGNWNAVAGWLDGPVLELARIGLPIGISFFTFQAMSYVVDVHRGQAEIQRNPFSFALYISLFPQLIAGPIVRYKDVAAQLVRRTVDRAGFAEGVRRFAIGLGKKMLIANTVAAVCDPIFDQVPPGQWTAGLAWLALVSYTLQIYFDFSGYSDMAIGLGRMLGFRFLENFRYPYVSRSITEFWRRWHISLSSWFRDYLYIPLGGNRGSALATYRNLVLVFLLCGLWHGASWNFLIWGLFHGVFLVVERVGFGALLARAPRLLQHGYALLVVMTGWVFFRVEAFGDAAAFLRALAGLGTGDGLVHHAALHYDRAVGLALVAGALGATPLVPRFTAWRARVAASGRTGLRTTLELVSVASLVLVLVGCGMLLAAGTHNPFIYFRF